MNPALVDQIAQAVLYEGYILYPYRPSMKNRQRWTFGGLYPPGYSLAQKGTDACTMQTQCLVAGGPHTELAVQVRFLHLLARTVGELAPELTEWPSAGEPPFRAVAALPVGDQLLQTWQEAVEREIALAERPLADLLGATQSIPFAFPEQRKLEALRAANGAWVGVLVREQQAIEGAVELSARPITEGRFQVTVRIHNLTPWEEASQKSREEAPLRSLASTHTILRVREGEFVSLLDPPEAWRDIAAACHNVGTWPVLVGEEGDRDTLLSAPIILYDYPRVAPESPGDFFDGTEIDELLTLRILTLTEEEKHAMTALDDRARALLHRTEALAREQLWQLHGTLRTIRPLGGDGP